MNDNNNNKNVQTFQTSTNTPLLPSGGQTNIRTKGHNSVIASVFAFACSTVGVGIVSLPKAIEKGGFISCLLIFFVAILANYTSKKLILCMTMTSNLLETYSDIGYAAYGKIGYYITMILQCITLFGVCTIFLILFGMSMNTLIPQLTYHDWAVVMGLVLLPFSWLKTLKEIKLLAYFGIFASLYAALVIVIRGIYQASTNYPDNHHTFKINGLSSSFNVIVFSFGGHSVLPSIALEMQNINHFPSMANIAYILIGSIYFCVAFCGYLGYGALVEGNVLNNFHNGWGKSAQALISAHLFFAYCIPMYPLAKYIEHSFGVDKLNVHSREELRARLAVRSTLVLSTILIASVVPYFLDMLQVISALSIVMIVFFFPLLFYMKLCEQNDIHVSTKEKLFNYFVMFIGVLGTVAGCYYSGKSLYKDVDSGGDPFSHFFY